MNQPLLVIFIGVPGSGKTYFATRLAEKLRAVRINSDAMRLAIFGSLQKLEEVYHSPQRKMLNTHTFGAMDYATGAILGAEISVVYEAIQRTRRDRRGMEVLAEQHGARLVLVSMEIDEEVAVSRVQSRQDQADSRKFDAAKAREVVEHFRKNLEPLERTDYLVRISGEEPFDRQFKSFMQQLDGSGV